MNNNTVVCQYTEPSHHEVTKNRVLEIKQHYFLYAKISIKYYFYVNKTKVVKAVANKITESIMMLLYFLSALIIILFLLLEKYL
jgi:hypothetical protein